MMDSSADRLREWRALGKRIKVSGPLRVDFAFAEKFGDVVCIATASTIDRDGMPDEARSLTVYSQTDVYKFSDVQMTDVMHGPPDPRALLCLAERVYAHELREFFTLDGVRIYDPHAIPVPR